jgi:predicted CopG family antitoxin
MFDGKVYLHKRLYIYTMSKIITITDDIYERLKSMKNENESFSKVIGKNIEKKGNRDRILAMVEKHKKKVQKAFDGVDSLEFVNGVKKNWNGDRYAG